MIGTRLDLNCEFGEHRIIKQRPPTEKDHLEPTDRLWRPAAAPASRGVVEAVEVGEPLYRESPRYNFPHTIAQEIVREAQQPTASTGAARTDDHELGIFYTCDVDDADQDVGSIAVVLPMTGNTRLWRFGDASDDAIDLTNGMRWT